MNTPKLTERLKRKILHVTPNEIMVHSKISRILAGPNLSSKLSLGEQPSFIKSSKLPKKILDLLDIKPVANKPSELPFEITFRCLVKECCDGGYRDFIEKYDKCCDIDDVPSLARTHCLLTAIFRHDHDPTKMEVMFDILSNVMHGSRIPTTSLDAFKKYVYRKKKRGLPEGLIHQLIGRPSNHGEISDFMKDVIILVATKQTILLSAGMIQREILYIMDAMPNYQSVGLYYVSESKIQKYLTTGKAKNAINFALAEPLEFQRKVFGVLRFIRASAPLVKVHVDGYYFQFQYKDEEGNMRGFVGICFYDENTEYVFDLQLGESENAESLNQAFVNFFRKTKGQLPRELCMDKYTFKLLTKSLPRLYQFLCGKGVNIHPSSNPNNKSKVERFFGQLQQREMPSSIHFLGPGIKSKKILAHPSRVYRVLLASKMYALEKYELYRILSTIWNVRYNKKHYGDDGMVPEERYERGEASPVNTFDLDSGIPYLFFERHPSITVTGGTIEIRLKQPYGTLRKKKKTIPTADKWTPRVNRPGNIYRNRTQTFLDFANDQCFDVYVDATDDAVAHLYKPDSNIKVAEMPLRKRLPGAEFDRNEKDSHEIQEDQAQNQKLRNGFEQADCDRLAKFKDATGRNFEDLQLRAQQKKQQEEMDMAIQIGLAKSREDLRLFNPNKSRQQRRLKGNKGDCGLTFNDTI